MSNPIKINYTLEIDELTAFKTLCHVLDMDFVLDEETNYYCYGGNVYEQHGYHDEKVDDRADLFIALRNIAVNIIPNLSFKDADYIHRLDKYDRGRVLMSW